MSRPEEGLSRAEVLHKFDVIAEADVSRSIADLAQRGFNRNAVESEQARMLAAYREDAPPDRRADRWLDEGS